MWASGKGCRLPFLPPTTGTEAGHRASRSNRILINRTHPKAMTTTVVLAPKQHRKPGCSGRAQSRFGEDKHGGPGGCGVHQSSGIALCFSPGGGQGKCTKVPIFFCCPQHPGDAGIWAYCCPPALNTPDPNTSTTGGSRIGRRAGVRKLLRERFN